MSFVLDFDIQFKEHSLRELDIILVNIMLLFMLVSGHWLAWGCMMSLLHFQHTSRHPVYSLLSLVETNHTEQGIWQIRRTYCPQDLYRQL